MEWHKNLKDKFYSGTNHQFILHLNIHDSVLEGNHFWKLDEFLIRSQPVSEAKIIAFFKRGTGLRFATEDMQDLFIKLIQWDEKNFEVNKANIPIVLGWLDKVLHLSRKTSEVEELLKGKDLVQNDKPLIAVIFEYADTIVPRDSPSGEEQDRDCYVTFASWAQDKNIHQNRNIIILISELLSSIAQPLIGQSTEILPIKIPFPDINERRTAISAIRNTYPIGKNDVSDENLAFSTAGLTKKAIYEIVQESRYVKKPLTERVVFERKKKILEEQAAGLIEIKRPPWGRETIGALKPHKDLIDDIVEAMKSGDSLAVPMGILLVGPPGTGKTVFAEALAHHAEIPLVILKNIREKWVGQSERNLELVFELIRAMAPVIVFQDEIDQQIQKRGNVYHGDTGVSARLSGKQFEFMSDTYLRGKVVWLAATNRPDLLDSALLRPGRFDEKIPFLPPREIVERKEIFFALLRKMTIRAELENQTFEWEISDDEVVDLAKKARVFISKKTNSIRKEEPPASSLADYETIPYTGAEIEAILIKAWRLAWRKREKVLKAAHINQVMNQYIPTQDLLYQGVLTDLALQVIDSEEFLTDDVYRQRARELRSRLKKIESVDTDMYS